MVLCRTVYQITASFPDEEKFGLKSQLRRASVNVPSNVAEGCGRYADKDFSRFLDIAAGSLFELETQRLLSHAFGYIDHKDCQIIEQETKELGNMCYGLQRKLR